MDRRNASARPILGSTLISSNALVMSLTVASELTAYLFLEWPLVMWVVPIFLAAAMRLRMRTRMRAPCGI